MFNFLTATPIPLQTSVDSALGTMGSIVTWTLDTAMSHPLIATFFVAGLIGLGIGVFRKIKKG